MFPGPFPVSGYIGSHISNLVLADAEQSIRISFYAHFAMSDTLISFLLLMLASNFQLDALFLDHLQYLEKPSWSSKYKPMSLPSHRFPVQGMFPILLTSWFTPQLLPVIWHLSKNDCTSKQRCVTCEDCTGSTNHCLM